ncbi:MAG: zinc-dependent metalloprotease [Bacteroidetes bacterium]|nr:zinc-dependent metalloprotease [Bacteroidota bacterium]
MKTKLLFLCLVSFSLSAFSQKSYWHAVNQNDALKMNNGSSFFKDGFEPASFKLFSLNENDLASALTQTSLAKNNNSIIISVPVANGNVERFSIKETTVMEPGLQARYNTIHTYTGVGVDDDTKSITCSYNKLGFFASIRSVDENTMYLNPVNHTSKLYAVFARNKNDKSPNKLQCETAGIIASQKLAANKTAPVGNIDDGTLRTYRLALCTTGEWSLSFMTGTEITHQDSINTVLAALAVDLARANQVYETDLGIHMNLVDNEDAIIFLNPATDPFTLNNLNSKCQQTCDNNIGNDNYDIGHVLAKGSDNGNAGCIGCVCKTGSKGSGMSTYSKPLLTDYFVIDYWSHEMGHQYGANHTFTFSNEQTNAQIEPGSGSTIMGYAGITGNTDVQSHSDDLFGTASIAQISTYIKPGGGGNVCAVSTITGNHAPSANAGKDRIIPISTPFILRGSGGDADNGDHPTYIWEQIDPFESGANTYPKTTTTKGPEFRTYNYSSNKFRMFPSDTTILRGALSNKWESLSAVSRDLNFRFTVRDNHTGGGNNKSDDMKITVVNTAGPFVVTSPNTATTWVGGTTQTITWDVANTTAAPVNCSKVKIMYSVNGGKTFKVLKASTPNDGSEQITVPNVNTTKARIAVFAVGNIFFDISDTDFTISSSALAASSATVADNASAKKIFNYIVTPNPAKDFFTVVFKTASSNVAVTLTDANGKTMFSKALPSVTEGQTEKIGVQGFAKGNYFLKIKTDNDSQSAMVMVN